MQKITLVSLLICCAGMYAQEQLLSSIDQFSVGNGNFENAFGYNYEYDANDNLITESGFSWNSSTSQWVPSNRDIYQYNANGRASELTSQVYDYNTDSFVNDFRDLYTYDSNSNPIEVIYQEFLNGSYENEFRLTATYSNNNLISFIEYEWDGNDWIAEDRAFVNYNSNGTVSDIIGEEFQNDTWVSDYRDSFTYNGDGQLTRKIFETWNGSSYELDEEFDYTYDNNGNLTVEVSDFNFSTAGPEGRETYVYDTSELMSNIANPFVDKTGLEYVFDDFPYVNKILEERYESYDSNSSSFNEVSTKRVYNYNSTLSIEEPAAPLANVNVYPNPTSGILNIETSNFEIAKVSVYGLLGNQILTTSKQIVDLESFTSGVYFLELRDVSGQSSKHKVIKK